MTIIRPDESWYPIPPEYASEAPGIRQGEPGVPIHLKLAAEMMKSPHLSEFCKGTGPDESLTPDDLVDGAFLMTEMLLAWANRDEGEAG